MPMFSKLVPAALTMSSVFADDAASSLFLSTVNPMEDLSSMMTMLAGEDENKVADLDDAKTPDVADAASKYTVDAKYLFKEIKVVATDPNKGETPGLTIPNSYS